MYEALMRSSTQDFNDHQDDVTNSRHDQLQFHSTGSLEKLLN